MGVSNSLSTKKTKSFDVFVTQDAAKKVINKTIGSSNGQRFMSAIISAVNVNPGLQECDNKSILSGALLGESLKLSPSPQLGHYYLVPFNDRERGKVAQFILGYKGIVQLALRSGQYKRLNVLAIKEGELIRFDPLTEDIEVNLIMDERVREETPTIGYYAYFEYLNGFRKAMYWSRDKMEAHAERYSAGYRAKKGKTFWEKDFDGMAYKTMLRQLISKWGIMSIEMQEAYRFDNAVIEDDNPVYVDNEENLITETAAPALSEAEQGAKENEVAAALFGD